MMEQYETPRVDELVVVTESILHNSSDAVFAEENDNVTTIAELFGLVQ